VDLNFTIKNTKAVLDSGDILAYNGTEFELQNISDVIVKNNKSFKINSGYKKRITVF
jgi:hypothetical protein